MACGVSVALYFMYANLLMMMFNPLSESLIKALGLSAVKFGHLSSWYFYADAIILLPIGILFDKYSSKIILLLSLLLCVIAVFLFAYVKDYFPLSCADGYE